MLNATQGNGDDHALRSGDAIGTARVALLPYAELDGVRTVSDSLITALWDELERERSVQIVFASGEIKNSEEFVAFLKQPGNLPVFMYKLPAGRCIGVAWLNGIRQNFAFAHFAFKRSAWGRLTLEAGRAVLDYWWSFPREGEGKPLLDVLIGNIPASNSKALAYIHRLGFTRVGSVPCIANGEAMCINYLERSHGQ